MFSRRRALCPVLDIPSQISQMQLTFFRKHSDYDVISQLLPHIESASTPDSGHGSSWLDLREFSTARLSRQIFSARLPYLLSVR
jgi:hypothetical protein